MTVKLLKKGIKLDGKYYPAHYSSAKNNINGNATIYIKGYEPLPSEAHKVFTVQNDSDMMTDYFEHDRLRIPPTSQYFAKVEELAI